MTKEQREQLIEKILEVVRLATADESNKDSIVTIGGHKISRRLLYAGGSQWTGCGRDWDVTESGWAWVVDEEYWLTAPKLFGFDGRNMIERQTGFYLQCGYDEYSHPHDPHDGQDPIEKCPARILIEIGKGILEARRLASVAAARSEEEAATLIAELSTTP